MCRFVCDVTASSQHRAVGGAAVTWCKMDAAHRNNETDLCALRCERRPGQVQLSVAGDTVVEY